mmetsp:Transcript_15705/g.31246  ORF Transcript_15705/g.31246 Transcript_15705/m.31246 type:complete len:123 (+) Transcript_15705:142-510(+)
MRLRRPTTTTYLILATILTIFGATRRASAYTHVRLCRRTLLTSSTAFGLLFPSQSLAIKEKNDLLCSTGFFTNYRPELCTDLGDITDEGVATGLKKGEEDAVSSLMAKFDLDLGNATTTTTK